jgi:hypothetical protein
MTALRIQDPPVEIGATWQLGAVYETRIGGTDARPVFAAVPLTLCHARMQFRRRPGDVEVLATLTDAPGGGITLGGATGTIDLVLTDEQTSVFPPGFTSFDLVLSFPSGVKARVLQGRLAVTPRITDDGES